MAVKTGFDLVDTLFDYITASPLGSAISGSVYKYMRPVNATTEDVVLNSLALDNEQIQSGVTNINVYVPAIEVVTENGTENMPDTARMKTLAALLTKDPVRIGEYEFRVQQPGLLIEEQGTGAFYVNIRVEWNNLNF